MKSSYEKSSFRISNVSREGRKEVGIQTQYDNLTYTLCIYKKVEYISLKDCISGKNHSVKYSIFSKNLNEEQSDRMANVNVPFSV